MRNEDIRSKSFTLKELFHEVSYEIDYYQRDYAWGEDEVRILLRDLCGSFTEWSRNAEFRRRPRNAPQYFLGPFVYYEQRRGRRFLVDGQQRFVTLHLIFMHLRALMKDLNEDHSVYRLNQVVIKDDRSFSMGIPDHEPVLRAISEGHDYEPGYGDSLSRRNLWARSQQIEPFLRDALESVQYEPFIDWLLDRVALVGIQATSRDNGFRMFETMNDRGARLTAIDLLKSYLLSNAGADEERLNDRWRRMLSELTLDREGTGAPTRFVKAILRARYADPDNRGDRDQIEGNLNTWVRRNHSALGLSTPADYLRFVGDLVDTAKLFRTFLAASRELNSGFETIFFNERNGLGDQMVAILAALNSTDTATAANEKARQIADFIDRWYVMRVLQDLPVQPPDIDDLVYGTLVPALRKCHNASDVTSTLREMPVPGEVSILDATTYGLRGNNAHHVRYVLARVTAYVEQSVGRACDILDFLNGEKFHIEHLWPTHHRLVIEEIPDPVVFRTRRNQLGALGLLPARENSSLNDMPFREKIKTYARFNTLLGILGPGFNTRNTPLRDFVRNNELGGLLHSFGDRTPMTEIVETRQELILRLCAMIWDPNGQPHAAASRPPHRPRGGVPEPKPARHKAKRRTDVARMLNAGVLEAGARIVLTYKGVEHWATIDQDGGIILNATGGTPYNKVDDAGSAVRGTRCRGMVEWHAVREDGTRISLSDLRAQAIATGRLGRTRPQSR
ncbi:DUF262 domain-containing protein [Actinomadura barringtoniae]|uniref:DUF262 domain-containing protein n=1 Tax=Actinomadura barringtoniae TaxID=1427535 RepID=A0A939PEP5_9ACTN|nr:DUF262 domain-containing protein [Actinomadura barringtoniae]MBO2451190.1 DUF262 domain-containing protein [Actinomadura barringtoniae]